jgi:tetratricopeptide (TPR) repeat protein
MRLAERADCTMSDLPPEISHESMAEAPGAEPEGAAGDRPGRLASWLAGIRRGLAWIAASRFRLVMAAGGCLALVGGFLTAWLALSLPEPTTARPITLDAALDALDRGDYAEAKQHAEALSARPLPPDTPAGGLAYVLGVVAASEAAKAAAPEKKNLYLVAAGHLREACARGLPEDRLADGLFLLGKTLYLAGQPAASGRVLQEALKYDTQRTAEIHRLLAAACLQEPAQKLPDALRYNEKYLADRGLTTSQRCRGLVQRAEILLRLERLSECAKTLDQLPASFQQNAETLILRAQIAIHEAQALRQAPAAADRDAKAREKNQAAMQLLRRAQEGAPTNTPTGRKATYLVGVCLLETGDRPGALQQFTRARTTEADSPEVLAANLHEAELYRQLGRSDEALAAYGRAMRSAGDPASYHNPYVPIEQLRRRTLEAYQQYFDARDYASCVTLVQSLTPAFPRDRALQLGADTYRAWARDLLAKSEPLPAVKAARLEKQARTFLRRAGSAYERVARLHVTARSYIDDLWESANAYFEGHDYPAAVRMFREYLAQEVRRRNPQGWTSLGEALLAQDRIDEALGALDRCIELYPRDAASFRARLLASQASMEKGDLARAERLLEDNLNAETLTPASKEWRDSLFALGQLLYRSGRYAEAIRRLEEAVKRYPDSRPALHARYLTADAYRRIADADAAKLSQETVEASRIARSQRIEGSLQAALDGFRQTQDLLLRAQEADELRPLEKVLLRNSCFAVGSLLFDLGQYEAAIQTYTRVTNRYHDAPEALEAYVQIARAYRQLDKAAEARGTLKQAQMALLRMKPQAAFRDTTNRSRQEWEEVLKE